MTFWDHLDVLRRVLMRIAIAVLVFAVACFSFKETLFDVVLAPRSSDFFIYQLMSVEPFKLNLMNVGLTEQFFVHMKVAIYAGLLLASPYVLYELFRFIAPALYDKERRYTVWIVGSAYVMFILGCVVNYCILFPITVHYLGTYQVDPDVANMLTLESYIDTFITMSLVMGAVFELPVLCRLLSMLGILRRGMMTRFRRHSFVVILIVAAIITPTGDVFTLMIVALPIYLLYELSIPLVKK